MRRKDIDAALVSSPTYRSASELCKATFAYNFRGAKHTGPLPADAWRWFWRGWYKFPCHKITRRR